MLNILGAVVTAAPTALQLITGAVIAARHMLPGTPGNEQKQAAIAMVQTGLTGLNIFAPKAAGAVDRAVLSAADVVQAGYDFVKMTDPTKLQVHPDNTEPLMLAAGAPADAAGGGGGAGAAAPARAAAAPAPNPNEAKIADLRAQLAALENPPAPGGAAGGAQSGPGLHNVTPA
jgi:hypothetical protein